jgi:hypothetical protein
MPKIASAIVVLAGFLATAEALALRCGHRLITVGDHETKVLRYCGDPLSVQSRFARRLYVGEFPRRVFPGLYEEVVVEEWTYNFGPRKLMRLVRIEDGYVAEIRQLGYGFRP